MACTVNDLHDLNAGLNFAVKNQVRADGKVAEIRMEIWSGRPHAWIFREAHASCVDLVKKSVGGRRIGKCCNFENDEGGVLREELDGQVSGRQVVGRLPILLRPWSDCIAGVGRPTGVKPILHSVLE